MRLHQVRPVVALHRQVVEAGATLGTGEVHDVQVRLAWLPELIQRVDPNLEDVMTARRVRVHPIVLEHSLLGGLHDLLQELPRTLHFDPSLPEARLLVPRVLDFNVPLLVRIVASVEQIADVLAIDLERADLDEYLLVEVSLVAIDFVLDE